MFKDHWKEACSRTRLRVLSFSHCGTPTPPTHLSWLYLPFLFHLFFISVHLVDTIKHFHAYTLPHTRTHTHTLHILHASRHTPADVTQFSLTSPCFASFSFQHRCRGRRNIRAGGIAVALAPTLPTGMLPFFYLPALLCLHTHNTTTLPPPHPCTGPRFMPLPFLPWTLTPCRHWANCQDCLTCHSLEHGGTVLPC